MGSIEVDRKGGGPRAIGSTRAPSRRVPRSRTIAGALALAGVLAMSVTMGQTAASAADPTTATVTVVVDRATAPSGDFLSFVAGFEVSGAALQNAQIRLFFPRDQFRQAYPTGGGIGSTVTTSASGVTITYFLGKLTDGTIGSVSAEAASLAFLPNGSTVGVSADISGLGFAAQPAAAPTSTTLTAAAAPQLRKETVSVVSANGPAALSGQSGYDVTYAVRAASNCEGFGSDRGCLPFDGTITETIPPASYLVSVTNPAEYVDRATGGTTGPGFTFPVDTPLGTNLSGVPAAGTGPGATFDVDVYLHPVNATMLSDGRYVQGDDYHDDLPATPQAMSSLLFVDGGYTSDPPILLVTVWVPESAVPTGGLVATNTVRLRGPLGNGTDADITATADAPINVPPPTPGPENLQIVKDYRIGTATDCRGYGTTSTSAWNPASGVGNQDCVIRAGASNRYVIGIFSGNGKMTNPRITDVLPDELVYAYSNPWPGWTVTVNGDVGCSSATPDSSFAPSIGGKVRCVRYSYDGVFNGSTAAFELSVDVDGDVVHLGAGEYLKTTNVVQLTATSITGQISWSQDVAIVDRFHQNLFANSASGSPGDVVQVTAAAYSDTGGRPSAAQPHDWTIQFDVPPQFSYVDAQVISVPIETSGSPVPTACTFDAPNARVVCVAHGDPNANAGQFRVTVGMRIGPSAVVGIAYPVPVCAYSQPPVGSPVNAAGQSVLWRAVGTPAQSCATQASFVNRYDSYVSINDPNPPPVPVVGNPVVSVDKVRVSPLDGPVTAEAELTYELTYQHQPQSTGDLHGAYVYDFLGRHPVTGAPVGDLVPEFVSARATYADGRPETLAYTCTPGASLADPTVTWVASPCGVVTGVRWQLNSTVAPADPAGSYRLSDPPGQLRLTVRVPAGAQVGDELVNIGGIAADSLPPASGRRITTRIGGDPPVIEDFSAWVNVPDSITFPVPVTDADGDVDLGTTQVLSTSSGTAVADPDGYGFIEFTPDPGDDASEAVIVYRVCDTTGLCGQGTATIGLNHRPDAVDDAATAIAGSYTVIDTTANDTDPDGDDLRVDGSFSISTPFEHGIVEQGVGGPAGGQGVLRYYSEAGFSGVDHATYRICDARGACSTATISVTVAAGTPRAPTANGDTANAVAGAVSVDVLANDTDPDGDIDPSSVRVVSPPTKGTVAVDPVTGAVTYTPGAGAIGTDSFTYEVCDAFGLCDQAEVQVVLADEPPPDTEPEPTTEPTTTSTSSSTPTGPTTPTTTSGTTATTPASDPPPTASPGVPADPTVPPTVPDVPTLPSTGSDSTLPLVIALIACVVGIALVALTRSRRRRT